MIIEYYTSNEDIAEVKNVLQSTWDTEAGIVTDHTVDPAATRRITDKEMSMLDTSAAESTDSKIEDAKIAIESATTVATLRKAVVDALELLDQS